MPKLSQIVPNRKLTIGDGADALHVTYNPSALTPRLQAEMKTLGSEDADRNILAASLAPVLVEWDLTDDNGSPIGTDEEALLGLPFTLLLEVNQAIGEALLPNAPKTAPSGSFS